jgi:hypothetical protein
VTLARLLAWGLIGTFSHRTQITSATGEREVDEELGSVLLPSSLWLGAVRSRIQWGWVPFWVSPVYRKMKGGSHFEYQVGPTNGVKNKGVDNHA